MARQHCAQPGPSDTLQLVNRFKSVVPFSPTGRTAHAARVVQRTSSVHNDGPCASLQPARQRPSAVTISAIAITHVKTEFCRPLKERPKNTAGHVRFLETSQLIFSHFLKDQNTPIKI